MTTLPGIWYDDDIIIHNIIYARKRVEKRDGRLDDDDEGVEVQRRRRRWCVAPGREPVVRVYNIYMCTRAHVHYVYAHARRLRRRPGL